MGYKGGSLTSLFDKKQQAIVKHAMEGVVKQGMDEWEKVTVKETPVDTGKLKQGWVKEPIVTVPGVEVTGTLSNSVDYAPHVEYGTGLWGPSHAKYLIEPKKPGGFLRWIDPVTGQPVFARRVMHPGSKGHFMLTKGANAVVWGQALFESHLEAMAEEIARNAD